MSEFAKWFLVGAFALGALLTIVSIGKRRQPLTPGTAATVVAVNAIYIVLIIVFWGGQS
jgi:hypothetical protein